jgi:acetyl esterase/lipase
MHFHGGAFVVGNGRSKDAGFAARMIYENTPMKYVFCPQYRLASNPGGRFPAALQDGITALLYFIDTLKIPASRIVVSGDSAGANIALSMVRYITEHPELELGELAAALLFSPWLDPALFLIPGGFKNNPRAPTDYLTEEFGTWGAEKLLPSVESGLTLADPSICFLGTAFKTKTPLFFSAGECEALMEDAVTGAREFAAIEGNKTGLWISSRSPHDIILIGYALGFAKEAALEAQKAGEFVKEAGNMKSGHLGHEF